MASQVVGWDWMHPHASSVAVSEKGWTDGELGLEWIKGYDAETVEKARGRPRLLLLDGHKSHLTLEVIRFCRSHNIVSLCYPPKATHILQALMLLCSAR